MRIGPFYIDTKEVFLILAIVLLVLARMFAWPLYWFDVDKLLVLTTLLLLTKSLMHTIAHERFFLLAVLCIFATFYVSLPVLIVMYGLLFFFFRLVKFI